MTDPSFLRKGPHVRGMLASGLTPEIVAEKMGLPLPTLQRHFAKKLADTSSQDTFEDAVMPDLIGAAAFGERDLATAWFDRATSDKSDVLVRTEYRF